MATRLGRVAAGTAAALLLAGQPAAAAGERRSAAAAAPPVVAVASGGDAIPTIRTARGVTTMVSLPEEAREAVCGDLFDAQSGNGGYVIQRSGRDLFLKPLRSAGGSNLFVKTEHATFAFELVVVAPALAMRIVRVEPAAGAPIRERDGAARERADLDAAREALACERAELADELERRREALDREAAATAERLARERIAASVRSGVAVTPVGRRSVRSGDVELSLAGAAIAVGDRVYLSCTLRNRGVRPITLSTSDIAGTRQTWNVAVPPGQSTAVVVEWPGPAHSDVALALLDPSGVPLVAIKPFR